MKRPIIDLDFESRSDINLKKSGADVYAKGKHTDILCMAWSVDEGPANLWKLGDKNPTELFSLIKDGADVYAHNAAFELIMWNFTCRRKYGWPVLPINQVYCSMVMAFSMGLQGSLEGAAKNLGLDVEKDMKGHRIMLQLSKPREIDKYGNITWWDIKDSTNKLNIIEKYEKLYKYCIQDIVVQRGIRKRTLPLSAYERKTWILDQKINNRGVHVDVSAIKNAIKIVALEKKRLDSELRIITKNKVAGCGAAVELAKWLSKNGAKTDSVDKAHVLDLLERDDLPEKTRQVLLLRKEAARSSTAKLGTMIKACGLDQRVRGCFQYYGAASTGRWSGRRVQFQNVPRPKMKQDKIEAVIKLLGGM